MSLRGVIMGAMLLCFLMGRLSPAQSARNDPYRCCRSYSRQRVPIHLIRGYKLQLRTGMCPIQAIIFVTTRNREVCASPKDKWGKEVLDQLSAKSKMMSQGGGRPKKSASPDGSGLFTPVKAFANSTDSFY